MWLLRIELWTFGRASHALHHWAISPATFIRTITYFLNPPSIKCVSPYVAPSIPCHVQNHHQGPVFFWKLSEYTCFSLLNSVSIFENMPQNVWENTNRHSLKWLPLPACARGPMRRSTHLSNELDDLHKYVERGVTGDHAARAFREERRHYAHQATRGRRGRRLNDQEVMTTPVKNSSRSYIKGI